MKRVVGGVLLMATLLGSTLAGAEVKVGYLYVGPRTDYGYNYAQDQGRLAVQKQLGIKTTSLENVPENADVERAMERLINAGYKVIFPTSYGYLEPALRVAARHPDVTFMHCGGAKTAKNLGTYFADIDTAMYLAGMAAGAASKSGKLGFVAAHPIPQVLRNINAFTRGAQSMSPKVTTRVVWTGTWSDPAKETEAANALIDGGADVLSMHVDSPIAVVQTAERRKVHVVGYHADASRFAPHGWLVGAAWNWGPMEAGIIKSIENKTWKPALLRGNLQTGAVKLTGFGPDVSAATRSRILAQEQAIKSGRLNIWSGPIYRQDGSTLVASGKSLSFGQLESMNYFVKGVQGTLK